MPKLGMEPIRKAALVNATIVEIGRAGSLDVTVGQIARRAGMSSALAHHYYGSKEAVFLAAMRHVLTLYSAGVREALAAAGDDPLDRIEAILGASFSAENFHHDVVGAWLSFWAMAQRQPQARRLLTVYQRRLRSNLLHGLRPLAGAGAGAGAGALADRLGAMIDGVYLRAALAGGPTDGAGALAMLRDYLAREIGE
jgi:TetR/AcrR family transcriptional regulator, transcriptional repressor of bet genes